MVRPGWPATAMSASMLQSDSSTGTERSVAPLVSIVINNYNYARFVGDCIRSALGQTYGNVEVIVVDDGSTDNSREVISHFPQVRILFQSNGGQASAYNAGFAASRGEIILFLDADDLLEPEAVAEIVPLFEQGVAKVHFYLRVVMGAEARRSEIVLPATQLADGDVREEIRSTGSYAAPPASGNAYARFALAEVFPMPPAKWRIAADTYPIYLSALFGRVRRCEQILGCYRVHDNNHEFEIPFDGSKLRYRLNYEALREEMLLQFFQDRGECYLAGSLERGFNHLKARFASLALEPARHPFAQDRIGSLAAKLLRAAWGDRGARLAKKLFLSGWVVSMLAAPRKQRQKLVDLAFVPTSRPRSVSESIRPAQALSH